MNIIFTLFKMYICLKEILIIIVLYILIIKKKYQYVIAIQI